MNYFTYEMSGHLIVSDEDAAEFLQSQFSANLRPLKPGQAVYGLWLDVKGKIVADSWVLCEGPERFRLFSEHCPASTIAEKLERHIIADDVVIEVLPPAPSVALIGEGAGAAREGASALACLPGRRAVMPSVECVFESAPARAGFVQSLKGESISEARLHALRIEAGVPLVPQEAGPGELPGEVGLDRDAVDFTKGCFLGQEVVARMHNVGKPTRSLYLVRGSGGLPKCPAEITNTESKVVGELRSAYKDNDGWRGVALLKMRALTAASEIRLGEQTIVVLSEYARKS
jgi:folate-binding protein YgfZ